MFANPSWSWQLVAKTTNPFDFRVSRTNTRTSTTVADNYNLSYLQRTNVQNGAGGTFTSAGSVLKLENIGELTALIESSKQAINDTIKQMESPVNGLTYNEDTLVYNDVPVSINNLSSSEIIEFGVFPSCSLTYSLNASR